MKHLKKFNEELNPSTYISAGKKLIDKGQETRGGKLIDWGMDKAKSDMEGNKFTFYSEGEKYIVKWDIEQEHFITCANAHMGANTWIDDVFYVIQTGGGDIPLKLTIFADRPVMGGHKYSGFSTKGRPKAFVKTRKEAKKLLDFLHGVGYKGGNVNDLYSEDVEKVNVNTAPEREQSIPRMPIPKTPVTNEKPGILKRIGDFIKGDK